MVGYSATIAHGHSATTAQKRRVPEVQRIFVHCEDEEETRDLFAFCQDSFSPMLLCERVDTKTDKTWLVWLQNKITTLPLPYGQGEWLEFWADCEVFLAASLASRRAVRSLRPVSSAGSPKDNFKQLQAMRRPTLLVTDRGKLCQATADFGFMHALAESAQIRQNELLPVVLASDFRLLCGRLVKDAPLASRESFTLQRSACISTAPKEMNSVSLPSGVFLQRYRAPTDASAETSPAFLGARCLALFADGQCAYSAVSEDGVRSVEASGSWEVVNGYVVVGGSSGDATVVHMSLSSSNACVLDDVAYDEAIHINIEDLVHVFEPPIRLADCVARPGTGAHLRMMLSLKTFENGAAHEERPSERPRSRLGGYTTPVEDLSATFGKTWATDSKSEQQQDESPIPTAPQTPASMRTSEHALLSMARTLSDSQLVVPPSPGNVNGPGKTREEPAPRLLGVDRGITTTLSPGAATPLDHEPGRPDNMFAAMQTLLQFSATLPASKDAVARAYATCPLQPGAYRHESGDPGALAYSSLELMLHADGHCTYREKSNKDSMRSDRLSIWRVQNGQLLLSSSLANEYPFMLRETRGMRVIERRVGRIEMPIEALLEKCKFEPFEQQLRPFLTYRPKASSQRVFGVIDPHSPVLSGMKCRPDRIPYHAFEHELRECGIPCDDMLSDFKFIDRDADGQLSVTDMRLLENYGGAAVATEVIHDLRKALLHRFDDLQSAFDAITAGRKQRLLTLEEFQGCLVQVSQEAAPSGGKQAKGSQELRDWLDNTTAEDRAAVFASINPKNGLAIDLTDFLSLNLHTAMLAVRRLQHFQSWVFEGFGRSKAVFEHVFDALDLQQDQMLTRSTFAAGAEAIGYPLSKKATKSMFSMLDRNLDGQILKSDFQWLRQFNGDQLMLNLEALKRLAENKFGGLDECFQKLLKREQAVQGTPYLPNAVGFEAFKKILGPGLAKMVPNPDMKELFLFLDEAYKKHANGVLTLAEWHLLRGFDSRALTGSPARLRRILKERYGSVDQAFETMHTSWLKRALVKGLGETALAGLARTLHGRNRAALGTARSSAHRRRSTAVRAFQSAGAGRVSVASASGLGWQSRPSSSSIACGAPSAVLRRCASATNAGRGRPGTAAGLPRRCGSVSALPRCSMSRARESVGLLKAFG